MQPSVMGTRQATRQYNSLIENKGFMEEAKKFSIQDDRLDDFYPQIFDSNVLIGLENVVQIVLILSHSNAFVESGFSVNGGIMVENILESTVVAQHLVYEGTERAGGVKKVEVIPEMIAKVKVAHRTMKAAEKDADKETSKAQKKRIGKRKLLLSLNNVNAAKKKALEDMQGKIESYDAEICSVHCQLK